MPTALLQKRLDTHYECPRYDTKRCNSESRSFGMWSTSSLTLLLGPLRASMAVPIKVSSMGQIELFNHLLYLKLFNCVQTND